MTGFFGNAIAVWKTNSKYNCNTREWTFYQHIRFGRTQNNAICRFCPSSGGIHLFLHCSGARQAHKYHEDYSGSGSPCSVLFSNMNTQVVPQNCTQDLPTVPLLLLGLRSLAPILCLKLLWQVWQSDSQAIYYLNYHVGIATFRFWTFRIQPRSGLQSFYNISKSLATYFQRY